MSLTDPLGSRVWDGWVGGEVVGIRTDTNQVLVAWDTGAVSWAAAETQEDAEELKMYVDDVEEHGSACWTDVS